MIGAIGSPAAQPAVPTQSTTAQGGETPSTPSAFPTGPSSSPMPETAVTEGAVSAVTVVAAAGGEATPGPAAPAEGGTTLATADAPDSTARMPLSRGTFTVAMGFLIAALVVIGVIVLLALWNWYQRTDHSD